MTMTNIPKKKVKSQPIFIHSSVRPVMGRLKPRAWQLYGYYLSRANEQRQAWPSDETTARELDWSVRTVKRWKRRLAELGLIKRGDRASQERPEPGRPRFGKKLFSVLPISESLRDSSQRDTLNQESATSAAKEAPSSEGHFAPQGATTEGQYCPPDRGTPVAHEGVPVLLEGDPKEGEEKNGDAIASPPLSPPDSEKQGGSMRRPKARRVKEPTDPRFTPLVESYCSQFKLYNPGVNPPFNGSDGKMLKEMLRQQAQLSELELWKALLAGFSSTDGNPWWYGWSPLRAGFRVRQWCAHVAFFVDAGRRLFGDDENVDLFAEAYEWSDERPLTIEVRRYGDVQERREKERLDRMERGWFRSDILSAASPPARLAEQEAKLDDEQIAEALGGDACVQLYREWAAELKAQLRA